MRDGHRTIALVALVLLAGLPAVGAAAGAPAVSPQSNATSSGAGHSYSLDELRQGGTQPANRAPSTRWLSDYSSVWVDYPHTNPLKQDGSSEWQAEQILEPGSMVRSKTLRFHYSGPRNGDSHSYQLRVVYWQVGTESVESKNGTVTRQVAQNVTSETKTLKFDGSAGVAKVDLRSYYDRPVRVTAWVVGKQDTARWRFKYHTLRTEQAVSTNTAGERAWWALKNFVLWALCLGFGMIAAVFGLKRRAGAGPQKGTLWWVMVLVIGGGILIAASYNSIAELVVDGPQILAIVTVALLAIPLIEAERDLSKWLWLKPKLVDSVSASGGEALDALKFEEDSRSVVRMPNGRLAVVSSGILKFVARVFGGAAYLEGVEEMPTESRATGRTSHDRICWTSASAETALEYEPEGWTFKMPTTLRELIPVAVAAIALAVVGQAILSTSALGVLALPLLALRPRSGSARWQPANAQQRAAYITALYAAIEHDEAETLEESRRKVLREMAQNQKQVEKALEQKDATLLEEVVTDIEPELLDLGDGALDKLEDDDGDDENGHKDGEGRGNWLLNLAEEVARGT